MSGVVRRVRPVAIAMLLVSVLAAAAGCGGPAEDDAALDGTQWRLTGWSLSSLDPNDFTITATFADSQVSGTSAVNSYSGPYTTGPGSAFSTGDLASTNMAGAEPAMRAETAYFKLLGEAASYRLDGSTLALHDADGQESLVFAATDQ
jgi:heat shock protein HslJ